MAENANQVENAISQTRDRLGDALDSVAEKTDVGARLGDTADALSETVRDRANRLDLPGDPATRDLAADAASSNRTPIAIVVGFAIVGLIAGFVVPLSDAERIRLEPIGGDLAKRAIDARDEIVSQSKAVVADTVGAAQASAQKHGQELATNLGVDVPVSNGTPPNV